MTFKRLIFIVIALLFLSSVYGDTVVLKSGREIVGAIVSTEGDTVIIRDVDNIEYRILKSDVERVELGITGTTQQPQTPVEVTGPDGQPQQPVVSFDQEDNNSFAKANYLKIGTGDFLTFDGQVFPQRDRDYYYFHVEKAGRYTIKVTGKDAASRPYLRVMDGNNSALFRYYADEGEPKLEATFDQGYLNIGDKICFEIYQYGDNNVMDYTVELSVDVIADNYEPNNRFKEAMEIKAAGELRDFIFPKGDHDYYKFDIPEAGRLSVSYSYEDVNMRPALHFLNCENSTLLRAVADDVGKMAEFSYDFATSDKVYLKLNHHGDGRASLLTYLLKTEFIPVKDVYEPNNRFKEAKIIPIGQTTSAYLFPKGDRDYYRIDVDKPGDLDIKVSSKDPLVRPSVRMLTAENATFQNWVTADENSNEVELSREVIAVTYFIEVHQYGDNYASLKDYKLDINLTPSNDPYEPNDSFAHATEIELNRPITATIFRKGDRDYYKFWINNPCDLTVDIKSNIHMRMSARLLTANNSTLLNWQSASDFGKALNFTHSINEPGWYYVEVSNHGDVRGSTIPYNLILTTQ
ncbi:MAG: hypothetical protein ACLFQE_04820 [Thermotogota bacterium]